MPLLSVVIPTLNRPDTLRHALTTLAAQSGADCEFVIQNNGGNPDVAALVEALGDRRFRHFATTDILTLTGNWEEALTHAAGDYVTFIGDDDGLMPDGCAIAASIIDKSKPEILSWSPYLYYWPNYYHPEFRNRLVAAINYQFTAEHVGSHDELVRFYNYQAHYSRLPMIYNSFVRRDVIDRVKARLGRYFLGGGPDVTSGIANAASSARFVRLSRPLSVSGLSRHSTGHTYFFAETDALASPRGKRDFGTLILDPRLPDLNATPLFLANEMLLVKARLFPTDAAVTLNFKGLAQAIATDINDRPELYDHMLESVRELAARHGFDESDVIIPARAADRPPLGRGITVEGPHRVLFQLDGTAFGLNSIADAVRVMAQLTPGLDAFAGMASPPALGVPVLDRSGLEFGRDRAGAGALIAGWSEPEDWGTWSMAKNCSLRIKLDPVPTRPVTLDIGCRAFVHPAHPQLIVSCDTGAGTPQRWIFTPASAAGRRSLRIDPAAVSPDGEVTLVFNLTEPRSPADLGLSPDVRPLGIGIELMSYAG